MPSFIDLTGKQFGRLTVIARGPSAVNTYGRPITRWVCSCVCGKETIVRVSKLNSGSTTSCGCFHIEQIKKSVTKHGRRKSRAYNTWSSMKNRCHNPKNSRYHIWGGRGIKVCDEWLNDFHAFYNYMGDPPEGTTIDRIDNSRGYEPGNVRWATPVEQSNNLRTTRKFSIAEETKTITEWAAIFGCSRDAVKLRLKRGQNIEEIASAFGFK